MRFVISKTQSIAEAFGLDEKDTSGMKIEVAISFDSELFLTEEGIKKELISIADTKTGSFEEYSMAEIKRISSELAEAIWLYHLKEMCE